MKWSIIVCAAVIGSGVSLGCERKSTPPPPGGNTSQPANTSADSNTSASAQAKKVNLNNGTEQQFLALPEVNEKMAHEFEEYRPYVSIEQFRKEMAKYVDAEQIARYEQHVYVPVAINDCDAPTLQQLPGVDGAIASALMEARPFASNDAFVEALAEHVTADQAETARMYLAAQ